MVGAVDRMQITRSCILIRGTFAEKQIMNKKSSFSLDPYSHKFIQNCIKAGLYNNAEEVILAGLRLLEEEENRFIALRKAIEEGIDSGIIEDFNFENHLETLKTERRTKG